MVIGIVVAVGVQMHTNHESWFMKIPYNSQMSTSLSPTSYILSAIIQ